MGKITLLFNDLRDDINKEDSVVVTYLGDLTNLLFLAIKWLGIPFFLYTIIQFINLG
jgi:hypothetical protein